MIKLLSTFWVIFYSNNIILKMTNVLKNYQVLFFLILAGFTVSYGNLNCTTDILSKCQLCPNATFTTNQALCSCCPTSHCPNLEGCLLCPKGFYKNGTVCLECGPGYESVDSERLSCAKCKKGYFKNTTMSSCTPCPQGQQALEEGTINCQLCPKGKFKSVEFFCQECELGSNSLQQGASHCDLCILGFFCPCPTCLPTKCPARGFCPQGSSSPLYCDWVLYEKTGPNPGDCVMSQQLMGIVLGFAFLGALIASLCLARAFCGPYRPIRQTRQHLISEDSLLINDSSSDLFYTGL